MSRILTSDKSPQTPTIPLKLRWLHDTDSEEEETSSPPSSIVFTGSFPTLEFVTDPNWFLFRNLVVEWRRERNSASSVMQMVICPSYQAIIAMGEHAIPLILKQLGSEGTEPDHWFWALRVISGIDPVRGEDRGDIRRMAEAWLKWGEDEGHAW